MYRRNFIKLTAITGTATALASCGNPENQIIRFVPEDEMIPGLSVWKPSVCPLCGSGCGLTVRVMDADVDVVREGQAGVVRMPVAKKLEGLPAHPVLIVCTARPEIDELRPGLATADHRQRIELGPLAPEAAECLRVQLPWGVVASVFQRGIGREAPAGAVVSRSRARARRRMGGRTIRLAFARLEA